MYSLLRLVIVSVFLCLFTSLILAQNVEQGVIRVKVKENQVNRIQRSSLGYGQFGIHDIDEVSSSLGVRTIKRHFREAGKFEKAHQRFGLHLWYEIVFDKKTPVASALNAYRNLSHFDVVEEMQRYQAIEPVDQKSVQQSSSALTGPTNDPLFVQQWHYKNTGQSGGSANADISLPQAWSAHTGDPA
jgi:hypothetical protein